MTRLGRADLHVHTDASDGMASAEEMLIRAARAGLDIVAVTDHDDLRGGLRAQEAAARSGSAVRVIPGVELTTRGGHLLALFPGAGAGTPDAGRATAALAGLDDRRRARAGRGRDRGASAGARSR